MANENQTIIIKKIKKGGHGHHGGAWKVAYADFVTAMMAFFLLLWLLASTSEDQKKGIAEFFTPTQGLKGEMGIGFEGGLSTQTESGTAKNDSNVPGLVSGQPEAGVTTQNDAQSLVEGDLESQIFDAAEKEIKQIIEESPELKEFEENIILEQTPEGLRIELRDSGELSMFDKGSYKLTANGSKILKAMVPVIRKLPNHLSLTGHTDGSQFVGENGTGNWELSSNRALSTRRFLEANEMTKERVKKIVGRASEDPVLVDDPLSPVNRRIEMILLRGSHLGLLPENQTAPRSLLSTPNGNAALLKRQRNIEKQKPPVEVKE